MPARNERARFRSIVRRLLHEYPPGHPARPGAGRKDPLSELIFTTLSQNTSDVNRDRAWASMKKAFPTWKALLASRPAELERAIAVGGLAKTKAPRIRAILQEVIDREGRPSLARLERMSDEDVAAYLETLPGIGPKTIACVLAFSLERPRLPVDTHVHRVGSRLGVFGERANARDAQAAVEAAVPAGVRVETHLALIAHGRTTCAAQRPACGRCVLADLCPSVGRFASIQ
ncbi:MAG: endonuclease III domain-containing protein [Actinomycetota bacterium]